VTTDQKGAIAEAAIVQEAVKLGVGVYKPVHEGLRCDLIFEVGNDLLRVQCKWAVRRGDIVVVRCYSCRRGRAGMIRRSYTCEEIDGFAAYCDELRACYFVPIDRFPRRSELWLRLGPTRNNQRAGINWAEDFDLAATLGRRLGP
jgi:hypothetical protein